MKRQTSHHLYTALAASALLALGGCVSIAPIEPIKNPPTKFRSDNAVDVEFLHPILVGPRCGERGTALYGMPVFHAMACGNGKLITMPDPCDTITGGGYADILCELRGRVSEMPDEPELPDWQSLLQPASFVAPAAEKPKDTNASDVSVRVEFVHPSAVYQRCETRGLQTVSSSDGEVRSCGDHTLLTLPNPCMMLSAGWYPRTLCHEMAHANGWAMDHPGGSFKSDKMAGVNPDDVPPPREVMAALTSSAQFRPASESPAYLAWVASRVPAEPAPAVLLASAPDTFTPALTLLDTAAPDLWQFVEDVPSSPGRHLALRRNLQFASASVNGVEAHTLMASVQLHAAQAVPLPVPSKRSPPKQPDIWFAAVRAGRGAYLSARDMVIAAWASSASIKPDAAIAAGDDAMPPAAVAPKAVVEPAPLPVPESPRAPKLKPALDRPRNDQVATGV